jgi:hypothetical protein
MRKQKLYSLISLIICIIVIIMIWNGNADTYTKAVATVPLGICAILFTIFLSEKKNYIIR